MIKEFFKLIGLRLLSIPLWIALALATIVWYTFLSIGVILLSIPCWLLFGDGFIWMPDAIWFMWYYDDYYKKIEKRQELFNKKYRKSYGRKDS
jgi:hypothetical protein